MIVRRVQQILNVVIVVVRVQIINVVIDDLGWHNGVCPPPTQPAHPARPPADLHRVAHVVLPQSAGTTPR